jgi:hypothetical protein
MCARGGNETGLELREWIYMAQYVIQCRVVVNTVMSLQAS